MKWFTVERVDSETFVLSEYGHWEQPHSYLLLGQDRALLIDTGLGVADLRAAVTALTKLPVRAALTHAHWDHMGALAAFPEFALHEAEAPWLTDGFPLPAAAVRAQLTREPCVFPEGFSPETYQVFQGPPARRLREGDRLELGGRTLQVLHTPGHSPGHVCYYEPERGYLFSGDLIYGGCLDAFYPSTDPEAFRNSVERRRIWRFRGFCLGITVWRFPQRSLDRCGTRSVLWQSRESCAMAAESFPLGPSASTCDNWTV